MLFYGAFLMIGIFAMNIFSNTFR